MTERTRPRTWREAWDYIKDQRIGDLVGKAEQYAKNVEAGADPIEALHGHLCGPDCMHWETMSEAQKEKLRKAPWNQKKANE